MNIDKLLALSKLENATFKLTKVGSKRENSQVGVGLFEVGDLSIVELNLKEGMLPAVMITGNGFNYLRTSPIVAIVEETETTVKFETEGGFYFLEQV